MCCTSWMTSAEVCGRRSREFGVQWWTQIPGLYGVFNGAF